MQQAPVISVLTAKAIQMKRSCVNIYLRYVLLLSARPIVLYVHMFWVPKTTGSSFPWKILPHPRNIKVSHGNITLST